MLLTLKQRNTAVEELNKKLRLEAIFIRELRPLLREMNRAFVTQYASSRRVLDFRQFEPDVAALLRKQYNRTQREFTGQVKSLNNLPAYEQKQNDLLAAGLLAWITQKLTTQPQEIITTSQRDAEQAAVDAQMSLIEEQEEITPQTIAVTAGALNRRKLFGRITGIAMTETQSAAESTKLIEAEVAAGRRPYTLEGDPFVLTDPREEPLRSGTKQWVTVNDSRVRPSHREADRQTVGVDEPFIVGGQRMRHPGDSSLGARLREWINCRCSASIELG